MSAPASSLAGVAAGVAVGVAEVVRFGLELVVLALFTVGGWQLGGPGWWRWPLAVAGAALFVVGWGIWGAPNSARTLDGLPRALFELAVLAVACCVLWRLDRLGPAVVLAALAVADSAALHLLDRS